MTALGDKARLKAYRKILDLGVTGTFTTPGTGDPATGTVSGALVYSNVSCSPPVPVEKSIVGQGGAQASDWIVYLSGTEASNKGFSVSQGMSVTLAGRTGKVEEITEHRADDGVVALFEIRCR